MLEKFNDTLKEHHKIINKRKIKILVCSEQQIYANVALDEIMLEKQFTNLLYLESKSDKKSHTDTVGQRRLVQSFIKWEIL